MKLRESDALIKRLFSSEETSRDDAVRELCVAISSARTRVLSGLAFSAASSAPTLTVYRCKYSAGAALIDGEAEILGATDPLVLIGEGAIVGLTLDGDQAAVLDEAGQAVAVAVAVVEGGELAAVFGDVDDSGANDPIHPTLDEVRAALIAADPWLGWDRMTGMVIGRLEIERHKVVTYTPAGSIVEGSEFAIVINGTAYTVTADSDDDATAIAGKFVTAIGENEAGVTVSGTTTVVLTADAGTTFTSSSTASGDATLAGVQADAVGFTFVDPSTDEDHAAERAAGSLFSWGA